MTTQDTVKLFQQQTGKTLSSLLSRAKRVKVTSILFMLEKKDNRSARRSGFLIAEGNVFGVGYTAILDHYSSFFAPPEYDYIDFKLYYFQNGHRETIHVWGLYEDKDSAAKLTKLIDDGILALGGLERIARAIENGVEAANEHPMWERAATLEEQWRQEKEDVAR